MKNLRDKVAVVTGAASGIGRGIAESLAAEGMQIALADIEGSAAEAVAESLRRDGARAIGVETDVSDAAAVERLAEHVWTEFGGAHVLCNNAGVLIGGTLHEATASDWRWILSVNVEGVANGCRAFVPRMLEQADESHIVNTASLGGLVSGGRVGAYCATKYAVVGYSEALREELAGRGIGVSVLCPGGVRTNLLEAERNRPGELGASSGSTEILREMLEKGADPRSVGDCVVRGIRDDAAYIFSHPEVRPLVEARFQRILEDFDRSES